MIEAKCVFINNIRINKLLISIYVSDCFQKYNEGKIILSSVDIDNAWVQRVLKSASMDSDTLVCTDVDRVYLSLYVLFSLKKRIYIDDVVAILGYEYIEDHFAGKSIIDASFDMLNEYMAIFGYGFHILASANQLYSAGAAPYYKIKNIKCCNGCKAILNKLKKNHYKRAIIRKVRRYFSKCLNVILFPFDKVKLKKKYINVNRLRFDTESGSIFYKITSDNDIFFAKRHTLISDSLEGEYNAGRQLRNVLGEYCIFPVINKSNRSFVVYPFHKTLSLKDVLRERRLSEAELTLLLDFFKRVLHGLYEEKVVHRDITPGNIMVYQNKGEIIEYKLMDFGMAIINNNSMRYGFRQKEIEKTCGGDFRYSYDTWDDMVSAWAVCISATEYMTPNNKRNISDLRKMIGNIQYSINPEWLFV